MGLLDSITDTLFGSDDADVSFASTPETPGAKKARTKLEELAFGDPPDVPLRKIADLQPQGEERQLARETAKELAQPIDIFSLPEVQGIILEATKRGDLLANRLGRGLRNVGADSATSGRDVLGRATTEVSKEITSRLAPFAAEERRRRAGLIPILESLGLTEEDRLRGFEQAGLSAAFEKELTESQQLQTFTIPLLQAVLGTQPAQIPIISGGDPSIFSQLLPTIGDVFKGISNKKDKDTTKE